MKMTAMGVSNTAYLWLSRLIGGVLLAYGGAALGSYGVYVATGYNATADLTNPLGFLFLTLMSTFAIPLGMALFIKGAHIPMLMKIAGVALILNGLIRQTIHVVPELSAAIDASEPSIEFVVFGLFGLIAVAFKPKDSTQQAV